MFVYVPFLNFQLISALTLLIGRKFIKSFVILIFFLLKMLFFFAILSYYCNDIPYKYKIFIILSVLLALVCVQI